MRQIFGEIGWEKKALVFFVGILMFVVVGPFGTYEIMTLAERFVFWTTVMIGVGFFMHVAITFALVAPALAPWPRVLRIALGSAVAAIPGAAIVEFTYEVFAPNGVNSGSLIQTWVQVTLLGTLIGIVEYVDWRGKPSEETPLREIAFHKRLSPDVGTDIVSLSMHDHYVEVTTTHGKDMILMRLSDALRELDGLPGARIHRSHWVALAHLEGLSTQGHRNWVRLSDGRELSVSKTYLPEVRKLLGQTA